METKVPKSYKEGNNFKERDFLLLFIYFLKQNGINEFIEEEIMDKLYYYKCDEKYKELFENIFPSGFYKKLNLYNGLSNIKALRYVTWWSDNTDKLLINMPSSLLQYLESTYSSEYIELMKQLTAEHLLRSEIEKKARKKLNIYGIEPNKDYELISGIYKGLQVDWQIITDGILSKNDYFEMKPDAMVTCDDPSDKFTAIGLTEVKSRYITIKNANFVIEQGKMGFDAEKINLYTRIMNKSLLELLAECSTKIYFPERDELLTTQKPYVFSLKNPRELLK